jgi:hypothetical protein
MRKIIGLCFLTATLLAGSARAQSIFIEKGDPSASIVTVGGGLVKNAFDGTVGYGYSYRGVFDLGVDVTGYKYTAGVNNNLTAFSVMPYLNWHALRSDPEGMPISIAFSLGVGRLFYMGNGLVANPEGWNLVLGGSVYRRFELGTSLVFIPEVFLGYDLMYTRYYSTDQRQNSGNTPSGAGYGYEGKAEHNVRVLVRPNLLIPGAGKVTYTITPYVGWQGGLAAGALVGFLF